MSSRAAERAHWIWTALAAVLALLTVGYALALLVAGVYVDAFEEPTDAPGALVCLGLALVPFVVGVFCYRRGRRRGMSGGTIVRSTSLALLVTALALFTLIVLLSAPI
jgi:MFS family permease